MSEVLDLIGGKWPVLVLGALSRGTLRYSELQRAVEGVSQRMLTLTLKELEASGLVSRTIFPTVPPRVDYALTPLGETLVVPLRGMKQWALTHRDAVRVARAAHATRSA